MSSQELIQDAQAKNSGQDSELIKRRTLASKYVFLNNFYGVSVVSLLVSGYLLWSKWHVNRPTYLTVFGVSLTASIIANQSLASYTSDLYQHFGVSNERQLMEKVRYYEFAVPKSV